MPTTKAAAKALRQSKKNRIRNLKAINTIKSLAKDTRKLVTAGKADDAKAKLLAAIKALDKAAARGIIHKNAAARKKSRLMAAVKKLGK